MRRWRRGIAAACVAGVALATPTYGFGQDATVLFDRHLSPASGASVAGAVGQLVAAVEDHVVPRRVVTARGRLGGTVNIGYRWARLELFDQPQENWLRVVNHEVSGHGGRLQIGRAHV